MPKNKFWVIITLALLASAVWVISVLADTIYLPVVSHEPTVTPTITPTPTQTMTPTVTSTPTRTATPTRAPVDIRIDDIINGNTTNDLNDEYIVIVNEGSEDVNLEDWRIRSERQPFFYTFPDFTLDRDDSVRIWTKSGTDTNTNLYMDLTAPVWNNVGDCGLLRDDGSGNGELIDRWCYGTYERLYPNNP